MEQNVRKTLIYALVARGTPPVVLAEYTEFSGNFNSIAYQCLQKLPSSNNYFTYSSDNHTFNYLVHDGFTYCVVTEESAGRQVPMAFLECIKHDFVTKYGGGKAATAPVNGLNKEFGPRLKEHMQYCIDYPEEISNVANIKAQVSEVKDVTVENFEKVLDCGEKIELLVNKTQNLHQQFQRKPFPSSQQLMIKSLRQDKPMDGSMPLLESEFAFALVRVAVAQICQSVGFKVAQNSALEALTDIATRYLKAIAKLGAASANANGRTQSNLPDIIMALEDLASVQGFTGLSTVRSCSLCTSSVIKDFMKFVKYADEIPFAQQLPPRRTFFRCEKGNFLKNRGNGDNGTCYCNGGNLRHVPRWLPAVPVVGREEKKREVKWGCFDGRVEREEENWGCVGQKMVEREANNGIEISGQRGKVRFKM